MKYSYCINNISLNLMEDDFEYTRGFVDPNCQNTDNILTTYVIQTINDESDYNIVYIYDIIYI